MQHKIIGSTMPVLEMTLEPGDRVIAEAGELSWMTSSIELHTSTSAGANKGFFGAIKRAVGGGSLFMTEYRSNVGSQKIGGDGTAWVELDGEVVIYDLSPGETLRVHPGHVGMFEATADFSITMLPGIRNVLFGGDGLFLAALTGPGRVWLQSLPLSNLAHALAPYLSGGRSESASGIASAGIAGAVLGGLLGGNNDDKD